MDFKLHFETAWQTTLQFIGQLILLTLVQVIISVASLGILAPVTLAGYMQSLLRALREGRTPEIKDLFTEMSLFLPLFGYFIVVVIVTTIGFLMLVLPGFAVAAFIAFATLYMIPLMTDRRLGLMDAVKQSWEMAVREPITDQFIITVIYLIIIMVGSSVPFGFVFTQPFATLLLLCVYRQRLEEGTTSQSSPPVTNQEPPPVPPASSE